MTVSVLHDDHLAEHLRPLLGDDPVGDVGRAA